MKGIDYAGAEITHLADLGNTTQLILGYDNLRSDIDTEYVDSAFQSFVNYSLSQQYEGKANKEFYRLVYGVNDINSEEDLANAAKNVALQKAYAQNLLTSKVFADYQKAETVSQQMELLGQNPVEILASLWAGSMSQFIETGSSIFFPIVGGATGAGAAAGLAGALSGFKTGMMGWSAITGYSMEVGAAFSTVAGRNNIDMTDEQQVLALLKNPELVKEAEKLGNDRGVPIGLMSILGSAAAGAVAKP